VASGPFSSSLGPLLSSPVFPHLAVSSPSTPFHSEHPTFAPGFKQSLKQTRKRRRRPSHFQANTMSSGPINSRISVPGGYSGLDTNASQESLSRIEPTGNKRKANRQACKPCRQAKVGRHWLRVSTEAVIMMEWDLQAELLAHFLTFLLVTV